MLTKPNTVLVASTVATTAATIAVGALMLLDAKTGKPVTDVTGDLTGIDSLQLGVCKSLAVTGGSAATNKPAYFAKTKAFKRSELRGLTNTPYSASAEDAFTLLVPSVANHVSGDNMHVKLTFKVDGFQTQKAEAYTFAITNYADSAALATAIANRINNNPDSWVTASASSATVTVTAKKAVDYQVNAKSLMPTSKFNQVEFELAAFKVNGVGPYAAFGTVTRTSSATPGFGNAYVVRDEEIDAFGYEGHYHIQSFPNTLPVSTVKSSNGLVDDTQGYDCISFTAELAYRAPDESYMKSTPVSAQCYYYTVEEADPAAIVTAIKKWANL